MAEEVAALEALVSALEDSLAEKENHALAVRAVAELAANEAQEARTAAAEAKQRLALLQARLDPAWRDWAEGLPANVLDKVAATLVAQTDAEWAAKLNEDKPLMTEEDIQEDMAKLRKRQADGNCLFVFAMVCNEWRKAQLKVGAPLRTRVKSDVLLPGSVALAKWALAEGCPRENERGYTMAAAAARHGHMELVRWLIQEQGFAMDEAVMAGAAESGNLELVKWLRGEGCDWHGGACTCAAAAGRLGVLQWLRANGCPWDASTCMYVVHVETLRWARENGCPWDALTRDWAADELGYTDDLGNLVDHYGEPVQSDDE